MSDPIAKLPLVSIVVPVFNGERYLRESLDSILSQSYPWIEMFVMDDASTDSTPDIIASYGDRLRHIRQSQNTGIYANANTGIALAQGKYIAVYHADDIYDPLIVEKQVDYLERHLEVGAVFCKDILVDAENREYARLQLPPEVSGNTPLDYRMVLNALLEYKNRLFVCPTAMVRASVYRDIGVYRPEQFLNTSDLEMWLRIAEKYQMAILEEYLLRYRHFEGQSSHRYHKLRTDAERYFTIMDLYLDKGGRNVATAEAMAAYEGHRMEDRLMTAASLYILNQRGQARTRLSEVKIRRLLKGYRIQRGRMLTLYLILRILVSLPRIRLFANLFYQRWHIGKKTSIKWSRLLFSNELST